MASPSTSPPHLRSLYRSLLRELPPRPSLSTRSPLHHRIRQSFTSTENSSPSSQDEPSSSPSSTTLRRLHESHQFLQYVRAQRMYATLLERYNPGMNMDQEERVRLSARRVGMNLPVEFKVKPWGSHDDDDDDDSGNSSDGR